MADEVIYEFIRGDDFSIPMTMTDPNDSDNPVDLTSWVLASQIRYSKQLISTATVVVTNAVAGEFNISVPKENTALWPARKLRCDIQFDQLVGGRISSQTFFINVSEDQTHD